jgi:hypothetical protein
VHAERLYSTVKTKHVRVQVCQGPGQTAQGSRRGVAATQGGNAPSVDGGPLTKVVAPLEKLNLCRGWTLKTRWGEP